ncbi:hypothetical protein GJAV_G00181510 [Gymnothorax javanicus]|nr:hypothetical protein GJAV_G00181510 [Gymnothorax javanicus]
MASIASIQTTGASRATASQDNLSVQGVDASFELAKTDLERVNQYRAAIFSAAKNTQVHPAVIAAIISRETRGGSPHVMNDGWGDHGNAYGLMQVDRRYHTPRGEWNSLEHLNQGASILAEFTQQIRAKFRTWSPEQQLKGGIAAYNCGVDAVKSYKEIDSCTTGGDYSNDVVARAKFFLSNGAQKFEVEPRRRKTRMASIARIQTSGASHKTAKQDNLNMQGVDASFELAKTDLERVNQYRAAIFSAAKNTQVHPAVIAAIISRETRGGSPHVMNDGWGDHGNAYGLMQVDRRYHTPRGEWNSLEHLNQGASILAEFTQQIRAKFENWSPEQQLKGGIAAYNCGVDAVESYEKIDSCTTGGDYSNDVVARAKFFLSNGYN